MNLRRLFAAVLAMACTVPITCHAWGQRGHAVIGEIADYNLSDQERAKVRSILAADPTNDERSSARLTLASVANWADEIRGSDDGPSGANKWHFRNNPVCSAAAGPCKDGRCVDQKLSEMIDVLRDRSSSPTNRSRALKWVVHLVGDIHQPLHVSDNGDLGGNTMQVALEGQKTRGKVTLHKAWDTLFVDQLLARDSNLIVRLPASFSAGTPSDWMNEGRVVAARQVYADLPGFYCGANAMKEITILDRSYQDHSVSIVKERLQLAGLRLAAVLKFALQ